MSANEVKYLLHASAPDAARRYWHYFNAVGWTWWKTHPRTPTVNEIEASIEESINSIPLTIDGELHKDGASIYGGGIEVGYTAPDEDGVVEVYIAFKDQIERHIECHTAKENTQ